MSWDEIKKAVNSDIQTPLDERMTYVDGLIPRGCDLSKKSIEPPEVEAGSQEEFELLNISGKGAIENLSLVLHTWYYKDPNSSNGYTATQTSANLQVIADGEIATEYYGSYTPPQYLYDDYSKLKSEQAAYNFNNSLIHNNGIESNKPIVFENSLIIKVTVNVVIGAHIGSYPPYTLKGKVGVNINYLLW